MKSRSISVVILVVLVGALGFASTASATQIDHASTQSKPCPEPRAHPQLSQGDSGSAVKHAQCLIFHGFSSSISVDGDFGPDTYNYVRKVQATCNLTVDGIIGDHTWMCLHSRN